MVQDRNQNQGHAGPNKCEQLLAIVSDNWDIVIHVRIAVEELVAPAENENSDGQEDNHRNSERNAQRRKASLFNRGYHQKNSSFHCDRLPAFSVGRSNASVGFATTPNEVVVIPSSEVNSRFHRLVTLGSKDRFRIAAGNFSNRNPPDAANQRAEQKRNRREWNEREKPQNKRKRSVQHFADPNQPARAVFMDRTIGDAVFVDAEPDQKCSLNSGGVKAEEVERADSMSE